MGTIIVYALVILWLVVMIPAVALPFFMNRSNQAANLIPSASTIPFRHNIQPCSEHTAPMDRSAA